MIYLNLIYKHRETECLIWLKELKSIKRYYLPEPLPLFDWNIEDYSTSIKISIIEKDLQTTTQNVVETTTTFATNFDFDLGLEEKSEGWSKIWYFYYSTASSFYYGNNVFR